MWCECVTMAGRDGFAAAGSFAIHSLFIRWTARRSVPAGADSERLVIVPWIIAGDIPLLDEIRRKIFEEA